MHFDCTIRVLELSPWAGPGKGPRARAAGVRVASRRALDSLMWSCSVWRWCDPANRSPRERVLRARRRRLDRGAGPPVAATCLVRCVGVRTLLPRACVAPSLPGPRRPQRTRHSASDGSAGPSAGAKRLPRRRRQASFCHIFALSSPEPPAAPGFRRPASCNSMPLARVLLCRSAPAAVRAACEDLLCSSVMSLTSTLAASDAQGRAARRVLSGMRKFHFR